MVLTDLFDVYTWGRGFEGQLGLSQQIKVASTPQYVKAFFGHRVTQIEAGSYYSLAIKDDQTLYSWGEGRLGQLGLGFKTTSTWTPAQVSFPTRSEP